MTNVRCPKHGLKSALLGEKVGVLIGRDLSTLQQSKQLTVSAAYFFRVRRNHRL